MKNASQNFAHLILFIIGKCLFLAVAVASYIPFSQAGANIITLAATFLYSYAAWECLNEEWRDFLYSRQPWKDFSRIVGIFSSVSFVSYLISGFVAFSTRQYMGLSLILIAPACFIATFVAYVCIACPSTIEDQPGGKSSQRLRGMWASSAKKLVSRKSNPAPVPRSSLNLPGGNVNYEKAHGFKKYLIESRWPYLLPSYLLALVFSSIILLAPFLYCVDKFGTGWDRFYYSAAPNIVNCLLWVVLYYQIRLWTKRLTGGDYPLLRYKAVIKFDAIFLALIVCPIFPFYSMNTWSLIRYWAEDERRIGAAYNLMAFSEDFMNNNIAFLVLLSLATFIFVSWKFRVPRPVVLPISEPARNQEVQPEVSPVIESESQRSAVEIRSIFAED